MVERTLSAHPCWDVVPSPQPSRRIVLSQLPRVLIMEPKPQRSKGQEVAISALNAAAEAVNLAEN